MKKLRFIAVLFVIVGSNLFGQQDVHFSQFYASPLTLNPGSAGMIDGDLRALMNYRNQWGTITRPYTTMAASLDFPVLRKMGGGMFGLGMNFLKDDAGDSRISTLNYALSLAYHLDISGGRNNHFLSVGFQGGMIQRSINYSSLTWDNQWNGVAFDQRIDPQNDLGGTAINALDLSAGLHWYYNPSQKSKLFAGLSMFHINSPEVAFNGESPLIKKYTLHGGGDFGISNGNMAFLPNFVFVKQGANQYIDFGGELKVYLQEDSKYTNFQNQMYVTLGPYLRWGDATYMVASFNWQGIRVGVSYDFNMSDLTTVSNGNGGFEVMLGYTMDLGSNPSRAHSMKFR